jgi:hypothetical protein
MQRRSLDHLGRCRRCGSVLRELEPVPRALERVGRKRELAPRVGRVEAAPVDLRSRDVQRGERIEQTLPPVAIERG